MTASTEFVVAPLTPAVGGLVSGVDLSRPLSERTVQGLRRALAERHVLFFQNQTLEAATQRDFASHSASCTSIPSIAMSKGCRKLL